MNVFQILTWILLFPFKLTYWGFKEKKYWAAGLGIVTIVIMVFTLIYYSKDDSIDNENNLEIVENNILNENAKKLKIHFLDVGQADAIYIGYGDFDMVVDGGNNGDGVYVVNYLKNLNVDDIEILVATHQHEDHIGGLDDVIEAFEVEKIIDSGQVVKTKTYLSYMKAAKNENAVLIEDDDMILQIDENLRIEIIETGDDYSNTNDNSVIVRVVYNEVEVLLTGDMEIGAEKNILNKNIQADILKAGHHGSSTSSSKAFLKKVNPEYIIISAGLENKYGHPHTETLEKFLEYTDKIYGTWENGDIIITTDGINISISADNKVSINDAHAPNGKNSSKTKETKETKEEIVINNLDNTYYGIVISELEKKEEYIKITNNSDEDIDISDWRILSVRGEQEFIFPKFILKSYSTTTIGDSKNNLDIDFHWLVGKGIWSNSKSDSAELYDAQGILIDRYEN